LAAGDASGAVGQSCYCSESAPNICFLESSLDQGPRLLATIGAIEHSGAETLVEFSLGDCRGIAKGWAGNIKLIAAPRQTVGAPSDRIFCFDVGIGRRLTGVSPAAMPSGRAGDGTMNVAPTPGMPAVSCGYGITPLISFPAARIRISLDRPTDGQLSGTVPDRVHQGGNFIGLL